MKEVIYVAKDSLGDIKFVSKLKSEVFNYKYKKYEEKLEIFEYVDSNSFDDAVAEETYDLEKTILNLKIDNGILEKLNEELTKKLEDKVSIAEMDVVNIVDNIIEKLSK